MENGIGSETTPQISLRFSINAHKKGVTCLCDWNGVLVTASHGCSFKLWNEKGEMIKRVKAHHSFIRSLCVWNNCLCSASADSTIKVWRGDLNCISVLYEHAKSVRSIYVYKKWLVSGAIDGSIKLWNWKVDEIKKNSTIECVLTVPSAHSWAPSCFQSWNGYLGWDSVIKLWEIKETSGKIEMECKKEMKGHLDWINAMCVWEGSLVSASQDSTIQLWNEENQNMGALGEHSDHVNALCVWGNYLTSGSTDKTIQIWTIDDDSSIDVLHDHSGSIMCLCLWNGRLVSGSADETVKIWEFNWQKNMEGEEEEIQQDIDFEMLDNLNVEEIINQTQIPDYLNPSIQENFDGSDKET